VRTRVSGLAVIVAVALWSSPAGATVVISDSVVDVGGVLIDEGPVTRTLTLNGDGEHVDLELDNCNVADGSLSVSPDNDINLNTERTITVTFDPSARGFRSCTVRIERHNDSDLYGTFSIRGTGQIPQVITVADPTGFGALRFRDNPYVGAGASSPKTIRVKNDGDRDLKITNVTISTLDYTFMGGTSQTITPGQTHDWLVTFNPTGTTTGARDAMMTFANDSAAPNRAIKLSGFATTATISVPPAEINFGDVITGSAKPADVSITNTASASVQAPLGVKSGTIDTGANPNWFQFAACSAAACTFTPTLSVTSPPARLVGIRCAPPAGAPLMEITGTLTFDSDSDSPGNNTVPLRCKSIASVLSTNPQTVDFGPMLVGTTQTKMIDVLNDGNAAADFFLTPNGGQATQFQVTGPSCGTMATKCTVPAKGASPGKVTLTVTLIVGSEGTISAGSDITANVSGTGTAQPAPSFALAGRGIDRHLDVDGLHINGPLEFPETFRNPGDAAPMRAVPVRNTGEYPLLVENITIDGNDAVWSLAKPFEPFMVPPNEKVDVAVKFSPVEGRHEDATIRIESDATDTKLTPGEPGVGVVALAGDGKNRNVDMFPGSINVGDTFAGIPARLSITRPGDVIEVVNMDIQPFMIRDLVIEGGTASAFTLQEMNGDPVAQTMIMPGERHRYDVVFTAPYPGLFESTIALYLDQDPIAQTPVPIYANAEYVDAHGGGGCSTGGSGRGMTLALLGLVFVLRRRRR
jgi:uncharacterized protein (TIGR03382 family)